MTNFRDNEMLSENICSKGNNNIKLSIAIPTYNGARYIREALDSIISQLDDVNEEVEIIVSDNASTDETSQIIRAYQKKYPFIKYFRNDKNLGADRNFDLAVRRTKGKYVWLLSDDDKIASGGIKRVLEVIYNHKYLSIIIANYSIFDKNFCECIKDRVVEEHKDMIFESADDFWNELDILSALVSTNIIRRSLWVNIETKEFYDSNWIHMGVIISILPSRKSFFVSTPLVQMTGGTTSWQMGGNGLKYAMTLEDMFRSMDKLGYRKSTSDKILKSFFKRLSGTIINAKRNGLVLSFKLLRDMYLRYGDYPSFWFVDLPLLLLPNQIYKSKITKLMYKIVKKGYKKLKSLRS